MTSRMYVGLSRLGILCAVSVAAISGCTLNADIADLSSNGMPVSQLVNVPETADSATKLNIGVTGSSVMSYVYKLGVSSATDCSSETGYSSTNDIGTAIADSIASLPDGLVKICVLGINGRGLRQNIEKVTTAEWIKDTVPPVVTVTSPETFINGSNKTSFPVSGTCSEEGKPVLIQTPVEASATCTGGVWSKSLDLSAVADGPITIQAKQIDIAKNQTSSSVNGIDKDEGEPAEISMTSTFAKVTEGNQNISLSIKTSLAKLYDTVVRYTVGGDATAGTDYDFQAGTITIPAGQTTASVSVSIKENAIVGDVKHLTVNLVEANKKNTLIGAKASKNIDIVDNDGTGAKTILDFTVGDDYTCLIQSPGTLKCVGGNTYGQLGDNSTSTRLALTNVNSAQVFKKVFANGGPSTCAQNTANQIYCWGWGAGGQIGNGSTSQQLSPTLVDGGTAYPVMDSGGGQSCAINASSKLGCWGINSYGQVGDNSTTNRASLVTVDSTADYSKVGLGYDHSCAITLTGVLKCWGRNQSGQLGDNSTTNSLVPKVIDAGVSYQMVSGGHSHSCGITTAGVLKCWGLNANGQLGDGTTTQRLVPTVVDPGVTYTFVEGDYRFGYRTCGITTTGLLKCWGRNSAGLVADGTVNDRLTPYVVDAVNTFTKVSFSSGHVCALTTGNTLLCWGGNVFGQSMLTATPNALTPENILPTRVWKFVARGSSATCAIDSSDKLYCWGKNTNGEVGDGTSFARAEPMPVLKDKDIISIAIGMSSACAVTSTNKLYCWGTNDAAGIGDGTLSKRFVPTLIDSTTLYKKVSVGSNHACGLTTAGNIRCWGANFVGQIGDGTTVVKLVPVAISSSAIYKDVSAGVSMTCAIDSNDKVFCWGYNNIGQLGDTTTTNRLVPTAIDVSNSYKAISSDGGYDPTTCGITLAGVLKCWGRNGGGQVGDGTTVNKTIPTVIHSGTNYKSITVGNWATCGITTSDKLYCWGSNSSGQLGDNTTTERTSPVAINAANNYMQIDSNEEVTCGLLTSGVMYCSGNRAGGYFANGVTGMVPSPAYKANY